jgi:hypothetical protein
MSCLSVVVGVAAGPQQPLGVLVAVVVVAAGSPQQPAPLPAVPQHPCEATAPGMNPPCRSGGGVAAGCSSALLLVLDVSIALLLVCSIPVFGYMDVASPKRTHSHRGHDMCCRMGLDDSSRAPSSFERDLSLALRCALASLVYPSALVAWRPTRCRDICHAIFLIDFTSLRRLGRLQSEVTAMYHIQRIRLRGEHTSSHGCERGNRL